MTLTTTSGATVRSNRYHFNLPIPKAIRALYNNKKVFRGTMGTSDPTEATRQVTDQKAIFNRQVRNAQRDEDQARLKTLLDPSDRSAVQALGGAAIVPYAVDHLRGNMAFLHAGTLSPFDGLDEDRGLDGKPLSRTFVGQEDFPTDTPDGVMQAIHQRAERAAQQAFSDTLTAEIRKLKSAAATLDQPTGPAPDFLDEGVVGIRELAMQMASDKGYSQSLRKKLMYTARRWIELHGDIPIPKWKKAHLSAFSDALKGLPITRQDRVHSLPIQEAIAVAKAENLDTMGEKMRQTRVDHMKSMATYAMDQLGLIEADPFGRFVIIKQKKKHSEEAEKDTIGYTPAQSRLIIAHCQESFHEDTLDRWAPIVALYTGMRREEIGQMFVSDVEDWGNGLTFSITDKGEYQSVKNKHSLRKIPVPAELLDMGFGEFVARRRQVGGTMLFMENFTDNKTKAKTLREVQVSGQGNYTETYGERFSRYVRKPLGLTDHGHNFHSTRHSWTTSARRAGINPDIRRLIAGRLDDVDVKLDPNEAKVDPVEADYGRADLLSEKKEALIAVGRFVILD